MRSHRCTPPNDDCRGATLVQYAMLVALVALLAIVGISKLGGSGKSSLTTAGAGLNSGAGSSSPITTGAAATTSTIGSAAGDSSGGAGSGSSPSGGAAPTTAPTATTTAPPAVVVPTTTDKPTESVDEKDEKDEKAEPGSTWSSSKATIVDKTSWRSDVAATIYGTDGKPLTGVSAGVQIRVVQEYRTWDGKPQERSWTTQANIEKGVVTFADTGLSTGASGGEQVVAMRYEVTGVSYYYPRDPSIRWDGVTPEIRLERP